MAESTSPPTLPEVFVERILDYADGDAIRPVTVRVYKPVQRAPEEWECTLEIEGLREAGRLFRYESTSADSVQALFQALLVAENTVGRKYVPTPPDIFVERILDYADGDAIRPVTVRIYKPVQRAPEEWGCILEIEGLESPLKHEHIGADGVQALFHALRIAGVEFDRYKGKLSWQECKPWAPVGFRDASEMML